MRGVTPSLYARIHFSVSSEQAASSDPVQLVIDYNDGYAAYLNGREITRRNLGGSGGFIAHDQPAFNARFGSGPETVVVGAAMDWLQSGDNVLAVQVHDRGRATDVRFRFHATLQIASGRPVLLVGPDDLWKYCVGITEPSGGVTDPSVSGSAEFYDWIELHNRGAQSVSLAGWSLTDRAEGTNRWVFPAVTILPGGYLLVLASGEDVRDPRAPRLHANFKLDAAGEYLGLYDSSGQLVHELGLQFPRQVCTHSYGWDAAAAAYRYFGEPSPGSANAGVGLLGVLDPPALSLAPGFHPGPVQLSMTTADPSATIRYTTDGSEPTLTLGTVYSGPVALVASSAVRARAFREGWIPSDTITRTYLIDEPAALQSLTAVCLVADPERSLYPPHGVTAIVGGIGLYGTWRALGPADYNIPMEEGRSYERPASLEIIHPSQGGWRQIPFGLRMAGSAHTRGHYFFNMLAEDPWYGRWENKPSFNLFFRNEYGPDRLEFPLVLGHDQDTFYSLRLRSGKVDWDNPFLKDEFVRRIFVDMGQVGSMGILVNLFVNGRFKCYYNLVERLREPFLQDRHGSDQPWDVIADNVAEEGDTQAWQSMLDYIRTHDMSVLEQYQSAGQQLDLVNLIDYLLLNLYVGNLDWPEQNYLAARERQTGARFRFYAWDAEAVMGSDPLTCDLFTEGLRITNGLPVPGLYQALSRSPEFRLLFADRVQKHFFQGGALTETNLGTRLEQLAQPLDPVMQFVRGTNVDRARITDWISRRRDALFSQLASEDLWPSILAPVFNQLGGEVPPGFQAELANPNPAGTVYFTLDDSDPRASDNSPRGTAYMEPITVESLTRIKARALHNAQWSPLSEATFTVHTSPQLILSEIMYHPPDIGDISGTRLEFVELKNVGQAVLHLDGFQFTDGIAYTFPLGTSLGPGQYLVLASDLVEFAKRYGGLQVFDQFEGNLENAGERIALSDPTGREILAFTYDDQVPWPTSPDGQGYSLVPADDSRMTDPGVPANWRASLQLGGSPGQPDPASARIHILRDGAGVVLTWNNSWTLQRSDDLLAWADVPGATSPLAISTGTRTNQFWRLNRSQPQ